MTQRKWRRGGEEDYAVVPFIKFGSDFVPTESLVFILIIFLSQMRVFHHLAKLEEEEEEKKKKKKKKKKKMSQKSPK